MPTIFENEGAVKKICVEMCGVDPDTFEEMPELKILTAAEESLIEDPNIPEEIKQEILNRTEKQKGFKFITPDKKEAQIVIEQFIGGCFHCWLIINNGKNATCCKPINQPQPMP